MKNIYGCLITVLFIVAGCNQDNTCYAPQQTGGGIGGGPVITAPMGGFGDAPSPKPQGNEGGSDAVPCGPEKTYQCTYHYQKGDLICTSANKNYACAVGMTVFAEDAAKANAKCDAYANTHSATCDDNCSSDDDGKKMYTCNGTATCKADGKPDTKCDYSDEWVLEKDEKAAANYLVDVCGRITNPGYTCKNKNIKCYDPDKN